MISQSPEREEQEEARRGTLHTPLAKTSMQEPGGTNVPGHSRKVPWPPGLTHVKPDAVQVTVGANYNQAIVGSGGKVPRPGGTLLTGPGSATGEC